MIKLIISIERRSYLTAEISWLTRAGFQALRDCFKSPEAYLRSFKTVSKGYLKDGLGTTKLIPRLRGIDKKRLRLETSRKKGESAMQRGLAGPKIVKMFTPDSPLSVSQGRRIGSQVELFMKYGSVQASIYAPATHQSRPRVSSENGTDRQRSISSGVSNSLSNPKQNNGVMSS